MTRTGIGRILTLVLVLGLAGAAKSGLAIEMFTFFGDGSRIGLPSLEVPVEAYPGIPLRSDRIRMRTGRFSRWRASPRQPMALPIPESRQDVRSPSAGARTSPSGGVRIRPMEAESMEWPIAPMPPE